MSWAGLPGHAARRHAGADVRPPHAALPRRHRRAARARAPTAPATTSRPRCVDENDPSLITNDTVAGTAPGVGAVSARIKRDAYGVPHIYSDTDAGVTFAAGYVDGAGPQRCCSTRRAPTASPALIDMPGVPAIQLVLGLYTYKPTKKVLDEATALQTKSIEAQGAAGHASC